MLTPLLVAGYGRSGTTALMSLLATDPRVTLDRVYPFENRYLTYLLKLSLLLDRPKFYGRFEGHQLNDFDDDSFGGYPWLGHQPDLAKANREALAPDLRDWIDGQWNTLSAKARRANATAHFYAEKVAAWVPSTVRRLLPSYTLHLFRDPRDMYLSANAFLARHRYFSFGRSPGDTDLDHARNLVHEFLSYFENYRADRGRTDCLLVRYEDLIRHRHELAKRLHRLAGLNVVPEAGMEHTGLHQTAASLELSIGRWRHENLPTSVAAFMDAHLGEALTELGYGFATPAGIGPLTSIDLTRTHSSLCSEAVETRSLDLPLEPFEPEAVREVWLTLRDGEGNKCTLFWRSHGQDYAEDCSLSVDYHPARHWRVLRFAVGRHERWRGTISHLRLRLSHGRCRLRWLKMVE